VVLLIAVITSFSLGDHKSGNICTVTGSSFLLRMSWLSWHCSVIFSVTNGCCQFADTCIGQLLVRLIHIFSSSFSWYLDPGNNLLSCHILEVFMPIGFMLAGVKILGGDFA
jgi:hypothetical protein